jgi:hypothetical protein
MPASFCSCTERPVTLNHALMCSLSVTRLDNRGTTWKLPREHQNKPFKQILSSLEKPYHNPPLIKAVHSVLVYRSVSIWHLTSQVYWHIMPKGCEKHEKRRKAADAWNAESHIKKGKARDPGLADVSDVGASNGVRGDRQPTTRLPGSIQVIPPRGPLPTGSQPQMPITPPRSSIDAVTEVDGEGQLEEQAQGQQERVEKQEEAQEQGRSEKSTQENHQGKTATPHRRGVEELIAQLNTANRKSAGLEKQIEDKNGEIDQLRKRVKTANTSRLGAIDKNNLSEAEKFRKQYGTLREAYNELEREKNELEEQFKKSRADVKRLELELLDSQTEVQSLTRRLKVKDEELEDVYNTRNRGNRTRHSDSAITMSNQISNEQNATIEEEQLVREPVSLLPSATSPGRNSSRGEQCLMWFAGRGGVAYDSKG